MIKIDRSFVTNIHRNHESAAIIRAVTALANALSVPVCVEGIENEATYEAVLTLGCEVGQGWYFGKADGGRTRGRIACPADRTARRAAARRSHRLRYSTNRAPRPCVPCGTGGSQTHASLVVRMVKSPLRICHACYRAQPLQPRSLTIDMLAHPRICCACRSARVRERIDVSVDQPGTAAGSLAADLRLFALTFAAGFLFVSVLIA